MVGACLGLQGFVKLAVTLVEVLTLGAFTEVLSFEINQVGLIKRQRLALLVFERHLKLDFIELLNLLREHVCDYQNLLRKALILIYQYLLIFEVFVLFLLDLLSSLHECDSELLPALLVLMQLLTHTLLFLVDVLVVLQLLIQCVHRTLQVLVHSDVHPLVVFINELPMVGTVVHWVIGDQGGLLLLG